VGGEPKKGVVFALLKPDLIRLRLQTQKTAQVDCQRWDLPDLRRPNLTEQRSRANQKTKEIDIGRREELETEGRAALRDERSQAGEEGVKLQGG